MSESSRRGFGTSSAGLLTLLFVALRLTGVIDWPWWLVLAPTWGAVALAAVLGAVLAIVTVATDRRRRG